jgi:hypothetical protein
LKSFEASDLPARTGKFIARKNWFIVGTDDLHLRIFNYNTHEKVHAFEGSLSVNSSIKLIPIIFAVLLSILHSHMFYLPQMTCISNCGTGKRIGKM